MKLFNFKLFAISLLIVSFLSFFSFASEFSDCNGHWAQNVISDFSEEGIILGYNGLFRPDDFISRADFAVILDRSFAFSDMASNSFSDLDVSKYYAASILRLNFKAIMRGDKNLIRPLDRISREEAFVMLDRAYSFVCDNPSSLSFSDSNSVSDWAYDSLSKLVSLDLLHGSGGKLYPKNPITRAEAVQVLYNIREFMNNSDSGSSSSNNSSSSSSNDKDSSSHSGSSHNSSSSETQDSGLSVGEAIDSNEVWEVVLDE